MDALLSTGALPVQSTGYDVDHSCKFESDNAESLYKDQVQGTQTTWTFSTWLKRTELSTTSNSYHHVWAAGSSSSDNGTKFYFRGDSSFPGNQIFFYMDNGGSQYFHGATAQSFRDTSAWYHIVWAVDTTQGTAGNRSKVYINGVLQTLIGVSGAAYADPPQNSSTRVNDNGGVMYVGAQNQNGGNRFNGYLAETVLVDGSQLAVTDFGEFDDDTGIWKPKDVSGLSFGTRGFYLDYSDADNLGHDADGSAEFTESYLTAVDQATDTPTNNFAIPNILIGTGGFFVTTEGATKGVLSTAGPGNNVGGVSLVSTIPVSNGKWYFEAQNTNSGDVYLYLGVADTGSIGYLDGYVLGGQNGTTPSMAWRGGGAYGSNQKVYSNNSAIGDSVAWETEVVGVALDLDNGKIYFHKSGTYINSGDPASGTDNGGQYDLPTAVDDQWLLGVSAYNLATWNINFGGYTSMSISSAATDADGYGTFEYAPPSGYYALCTKNLEKYG